MKTYAEMDQCPGAAKFLASGDKYCGYESFILNNWEEI